MIIAQNKTQKQALTEKITQDLFISQAKGLSKKELQILNQLIFQNNIHQTVYLSQQTIGFYVDCSRRHVNRYIKKLKQLGLILVQYRGIKQTCIYKISKIFNNFWLRKKLCKLLPSLSYISAALLGFSINASVNENNENVSQYNKGVIYNKTVTVTDTDYRVTLNVRETNISDFKSQNANRKFLNQEQAVFENSNYIAKKSNEVQDGNAILPDVADVIPGYRMTVNGLIKSSPYPKHIILQAVQQTVKNKNPRDIFALFISRCMALCREQNIAPNWDLIDKLKTVYSYDRNGLMVEKVKTETRSVSGNEVRQETERKYKAFEEEARIKNKAKLKARNIAAGITNPSQALNTIKDLGLRKAYEDFGRMIYAREGRPWPGQDTKPEVDFSQSKQHPYALGVPDGTDESGDENEVLFDERSYGYDFM